jgi:glycosyltransferase involved in cell wall biosynthesis
VNVDIYQYENRVEFPHVDNFGEARNQSLKLANTRSKSGDYILWADADDILADGAAEAIRAAAEEGSKDVYLMPYHVRSNKQIVWRERMIKARIGAKWQHAIHEQLYFPKDVSYRMIKDAVFDHSPLDDKTGGHERNTAILQGELEDTPRNLFYLAQEYFQNGKLAEFKPIAQAALVMRSLGVVEEYELLMQLAQTPGTESKKLAAEAYGLMPDRREALALLINYAIIDGHHGRAMELAEVMISLDKPKKTYWSLNNEWYGWKGDELYRQCLRLNGKETAANNDWDSSTDMVSPIFSIVHATLGRPEKALAIREMWLSRASHPENVDYVFGISKDDSKSLNILKGFKHTKLDVKGSASSYDVTAGDTVGEIIIQAQDDCYPPQGWDDAISRNIPNPSKPVFLATSDGQTDSYLSINIIITRAYMEIKAERDPGENGFQHRGYFSVFVDDENSHRAIEDGENGVCEYIKDRSIVIYHDHPYFNENVQWDSTYATENDQKHYENGRALFELRNPTSKRKEKSA